MLAKALAEKNLTVLDKIIELFYAIDDSILLKRNKKLIKDMDGEKKILKLSLNKLFNCSEELTEDTEKKAKLSKTELSLQQDINQPSTSSRTIADQTIEPETGIEEEPTGSFNDYWQAIKESIQFFKEKNIDLHFLVPEINRIVAYILQNGLTPEEKKQLKSWYISPKTMPARLLDLENISNYIKFYDQDPVKTCIALLKDYAKGNGWQGMVHRFFSGAWNRNYKDPVNKFLLAYNNDELSDNINICGIYEKLKESGLIFNFDSESKSSLRKILLFCAKLNNEEKNLLHLINNCSFTSFPPPIEDRQIDCCC
jgi:hypothetical protein